MPWNCILSPAFQVVSSPLDRREWRELHGMRMPVLSPVDLLLGQGLHVFKHFCGEFVARGAFAGVSPSRAHRRKMTARSGASFKAAANRDPRASLGLGVVTLLITRVMGEFAPEALTRWTVDRLPRPVRLWVEIYGHRVVLGAIQGVSCTCCCRGSLSPRASRRSGPFGAHCCPLRLPPPVIRAFPNESLSVRIRRHYMQLQLILARLRFHIVEGFRFALESRRWRRMKESRTMMLAIAPRRRGFDAIAPVFDQRFGAWRSVAAQRRAVREALLREFPKHGHILELGGGTGEDAAFLAGRGYDVLLTDPSPTMVAAGKGQIVPIWRTG